MIHNYILRCILSRRSPSTCPFLKVMSLGPFGALWPLSFMNGHILGLSPIHNIKDGIKYTSTQALGDGDRSVGSRNMNITTNVIRPLKCCNFFFHKCENNY